MEQAFAARWGYTQPQNGGPPPLSRPNAAIPPPPVNHIRQARNTPYNGSIPSHSRPQPDATRPSLEANRSINHPRPRSTGRSQGNHTRRPREDFNRNARTNAARQWVEEAARSYADQNHTATYQAQTRPGPANFVPIFVKSINERLHAPQTPYPETPHAPQPSPYQTINPQFIHLSNDPHHPSPPPRPTLPRRKYTSLNPKSPSQQRKEAKEDPDGVLEELMEFPLPRTSDPVEAQAEIAGHIRRIKAIQMMKASKSKTSMPTKQRKRADESDGDAEAATHEAHTDGGTQDAAESMDYMESGLVSLLEGEESFFEAALGGGSAFLG